MIEKQVINGKEVWLRVDACPANRSNPNIIPTEYFKVSYFLQEPENGRNGEVIKDEDGSERLFESPVAAITCARTEIEKGMR